MVLSVILATCLQVFVISCRFLSAFQRNFVCCLVGFHFAIVDFVRRHLLQRITLLHDQTTREHAPLPLMRPTIEVRFRQDRRQENPQIDKEPANCRQLPFRTDKSADKRLQKTDKKLWFLSTVFAASPHCVISSSRCSDITLISQPLQASCSISCYNFFTFG